MKCGWGRACARASRRTGQARVRSNERWTMDTRGKRVSGTRDGGEAEARQTRERKRGQCSLHKVNKALDPWTPSRQGVRAEKETRKTREGRDNAATALRAKENSVTHSDQKQEAEKDQIRQEMQMQQEVQSTYRVCCVCLSWLGLGFGSTASETWQAGLLHRFP